MLHVQECDNIMFCLKATMPNLLSAVFAPAANYRMFLGDIISYSLQFSLSEGLGKNYSQCVLEWAPSLVVHHPLNCCEFFFFVLT